MGFIVREAPREGEESIGKEGKMTREAKRVNFATTKCKLRCCDFGLDFKENLKDLGLFTFSVRRPTFSVGRGGRNLERSE
jgi:hypothetical protein